VGHVEARQRHEGPLPTVVEQAVDILGGGGAGDVVVYCAGSCCAASMKGEVDAGGGMVGHNVSRSVVLYGGGADGGGGDGDGSGDQVGFGGEHVQHVVLREWELSVSQLHQQQQ